jgi:hypothetical protein
MIDAAKAVCSEATDFESRYGRPRAAVRRTRSIQTVTTIYVLQRVRSEATGLNTQKNAPAEAGALE